MYVCVGERESGCNELFTSLLKWRLVFLLLWLIFNLFGNIELQTYRIFHRIFVVNEKIISSRLNFVST